eukprot:1417622-Amphidinium_carterae.1
MHHLEPALWERSLELVYFDFEVLDCAHRSDANLRNCSFEGIIVNPEFAHGPHHLEPALWERSLELVCVDLEVLDCAHRSDASLWNCSLEAVVVD